MGADRCFSSSPSNTKLSSSSPSPPRADGEGDWRRAVDNGDSAVAAAERGELPRKKRVAALMSIVVRWLIDRARVRCKIHITPHSGDCCCQSALPSLRQQHWRQNENFNWLYEFCKFHVRLVVTE